MHITKEQASICITKCAAQQNTGTKHIISEVKSFGFIYITFGASSILKYYA